MTSNRDPNEAAGHPHCHGPFDQALTLRMSRQSNYTAPEEEASQRQAHKNRDNISKKEHERSVSTLVTLSRHAIVADITRATPANVHKRTLAVVRSPEQLSAGRQPIDLRWTGLEFGWLQATGHTSYPCSLESIGTTSRRQYRLGPRGTRQSEERHRRFHCLASKGHRTCTLPASIIPEPWRWPRRRQGSK